MLFRSAGGRTDGRTVGRARRQARGRAGSRGARGRRRRRGWAGRSSALPAPGHAMAGRRPAVGGPAVDGASAQGGCAVDCASAQQRMLAHDAHSTARHARGRARGSYRPVSAVHLPLQAGALGSELQSFACNSELVATQHHFSTARCSCPRAIVDAGPRERPRAPGPGPRPTRPRRERGVATAPSWPHRQRARRRGRCNQLSYRAGARTHYLVQVL